MRRYEKFFLICQEISSRFLTETAVIVVYILWECGEECSTMQNKLVTNRDDDEEEEEEEEEEKSRFL
jgi:hypothetical protein